MTRLEELCGFVATVARHLASSDVKVTCVKVACQVEAEPYEVVLCDLRMRAGGQLFSTVITFTKKVLLLASTEETLLGYVALRIRDGLAKLRVAVEAAGKDTPAATAS